MRVLITGAGGFIGRALTADRAARGDEVMALDCHPFPALTGVVARVADVGSEADLDELLPGVEVVYHLAAAHLDQSTRASEYQRVNIDATRQVVRCSHRAGVRRFVHCSSVGVYGHVESPPAREDAPKNPGNVYERTKLLGEGAALEEASELDLDLISLRPAWVYGPGCPRTRKLLRSIARGRFFFLGKGGNPRHPVHLDDVLEAFHLAASEGPGGKIYNIAGPRYLPLREMIGEAAGALGVEAPGLKVPYFMGWCAALVAEAAFTVLPGTPPITRRSLVFFANSNAYSIEAAREHLGYQPRLDVAEGMRSVVATLGGKEAILSGVTPDASESGTASGAEVAGLER